MYNIHGGQMKLSTLMMNIKENRALAKADASGIDFRVRGTFEARIIQAQANLIELEKRYAREFRNNVEIVLLSGDNLVSVIDSLNEMGIVTVDAQEFYKKVAATTQLLSPGSLLSTSSFLELSNSIKALAAVSGLAMPKALDFEAGNGSVSSEENMRTIVRKQFGGAGAEPAWVIVAAAQKALYMESETDPLPVVVYNLNGAVKGNYSVFPSVHELVAAKGTDDEAKSIMKSLYDNLVSQGKVQPKKTRKVRQAKDQENEQEGVNENE